MSQEEKKRKEKKRKENKNSKSVRKNVIAKKKLSYHLTFACKSNFKVINPFKKVIKILKSIKSIKG